jgi:ferredoxin
MVGSRASSYILTDVSRCKGCRACELACSFHHSGRRSFSPSASSTRVSRDNDTAEIRSPPTRPAISAQARSSPSARSTASTGQGGSTTWRRPQRPPRGLHKEGRLPTEEVLGGACEVGPYSGERIDHETWERMLDEYYTLHGWDSNSGLQTRESLEAVDLKAVADRLEKAGKLR